MTIWTNLPDAALEPGKPIRSIDGLALRNNPVAITEGSSGAPKIQTAAIQDSAVTTAKLANDNVTTAKLANDNVTTAKLANDNVTTAKLEANERMTTANVLAATAAASVGAVGTYAFLRETSTASHIEGTAYAGSGLRFQGAFSSFIRGKNTGDGGAPAGTWRAMGRRIATQDDSGYYGSPDNPSARAATLYLRIS